MQIADQKAQGLGQFGGALVVAHYAQQRAAVMGVEQHTADPTQRAVIAYKGIDAIQADALVAHGNIATAGPAHFLAQQQLAGLAQTQLVTQVLAPRLADLIGGAQGIGLQQLIAMPKQGLALILGLLQALELGQVFGLFGTAQASRRLAGQQRRNQYKAAEQQGAH